MKVFQTVVALIDNKLEDKPWIVLVCPKTDKKMAMPCNDPKLAVICKAQTAIPGFGIAVLGFNNRELKAFYKAWKSYKRKDSEACDAAGYGPDDYKTS